MRAKIWLLVLGMTVACITAAGIVNADQRPDVIGYSADSNMETADGVIKGPVNYVPGQERREYVDESGGKMVMIVRHDKKVVWMVMPEDSAYMEMKFPEEGRKDDLGAYQIEHTTIGPETVNGVETTKSKIIMTGPNDVKMGGFMWTTKEGITVKMDAIAMEKGSKERFKIELQNLQIGEQDASLFEIPDGYTRMDMGGFGSMMGGEKKKPQQKSKKKGFGLKGAVDLIK
jgi:hypothetical protein